MADNGLRVSYSGIGVATDEVRLVEGVYARTATPSCYRKHDGSTIHLRGGCWYITDKRGQQAAHVLVDSSLAPRESPPEVGWQTQSEAMFTEYNSDTGRFEQRMVPQKDDFDIFVEPISIEKKAETGCYGGLCDKLHLHRQEYKSKASDLVKQANDLHQRANDLHQQYYPVAKKKTMEIAQQSRDLHEQYYPVAKQKAKDAHGHCYDFWTHPDTKRTIKKGFSFVGNCFKFCVGKCLHVTADAVDTAVGGRKPKTGAKEVAIGGQPREVVGDGATGGTPGVMANLQDGDALQTELASATDELRKVMERTSEVKGVSLIKPEIGVNEIVDSPYLIKPGGEADTFSSI